MTNRLYLKKVLILALLSLSHSRVSGIRLDVLNTQENVHDKLGKILKSCFSSTLNTLVITEELSPIGKDLSENAAINVIQITDNFDTNQTHGFIPLRPMYLLNAKSENSLTLWLQRLKSSDLWSSDSTVFIVSAPSNRCNRAAEFLHASWKMDLLASFYICEQPEDSEVFLYTYNPYTNRVVNGWEKVKTESDNRWTLYRKLFSDGVGMCNHLEFDKTKFLDQYRINAVTQSRPGIKVYLGRNDDLEVHRKNSHIGDGILIPSMLAALNITAAITYSHRAVYAYGKPIGYLVGVMNGTYDIVFSMRYIDPNHKDFLSLYTQLGISMLTKHRDFFTPLEKIQNFYSLGSVGLFFLALLMTWIVFVFTQDGQLTSAALEVLRLGLSTGVLQPLRSLSIRIYLFGIWWLVIILNATFQGNISSFLTKPDRIDINTLNDLKEYDYHLYMTPFYEEMMSEYLTSFPKDKFHYARMLHCYEYVLNNSLTACIQSTAEIYFIAEKYNLHIAPLPVSSPLVYRHRPNWPLAKKLNAYLLQISASGYTDRVVVKTYDRILKKIDYYEKRQTDPQIRQIVPIDLVFAFVLLAIGLSISAFFLLLEIYQGKNQMSTKSAEKSEMPRKFRNREIFEV